jgi:hypothetical protein
MTLSTLRWITKKSNNNKIHLEGERRVGLAVHKDSDMALNPFESGEETWVNLTDYLVSPSTSQLFVSGDLIDSSPEVECCNPRQCSSFWGSERMLKLL